jgi:hypothetical protein
LGFKIDALGNRNPQTFLKEKRKKRQKKKKESRIPRQALPGCQGFCEKNTTRMRQTKKLIP